MIALDGLLKVSKIDKEPDAYRKTYRLFDKKEIAPANEFLLDALRKDGKVTISQLHEHYGAREIEYTRHRLGCGMDFFLPCDVLTGEPVFDGKYVMLTGAVSKRHTREGYAYVDCEDDNLTVTDPNWETDTTGRWSPLIEYDPQHILGQMANGGFSVTGVYRSPRYHTGGEQEYTEPEIGNAPMQIYRPGKISCMLRRDMNIDNSRPEQRVNVRYGVKISEDTFPGRIHQLELSIQDTLRTGGDYVHYSVSVVWNTERKRYEARGSVQFNTGLSIDIQPDGYYSTEFRSTRGSTDIHDLNRLYEVLGNPDKQTDFAATIQNAFAAASTNSMSMLVSKGYLVGS